MRLDVNVLSSTFEEWAARASMAVLVGADVIEVADSPGGEIRFYVRESEPGMLRLSRAERSEAERPIMWSSDWLDVERYLTMEVGYQVREASGLGMLDSPLRLEEIAASYSIVPVDTDLLALRSTGGETLQARFPRNQDPWPLLKFSVIAVATLSQIRSSFLDAEGFPLFKLWQGRHSWP